MVYRGILYFLYCSCKHCKIQLPENGDVLNKNVISITLFHLKIVISCEKSFSTDCVGALPL